MKEFPVLLSGFVQNLQDDSFKDSDGKEVKMTRLDMVTGSVETMDVDRHQVNVLWPDNIRPDFLAKAAKGKRFVCPARVVGTKTGELQMRGPKLSHYQDYSDLAQPGDVKPAKVTAA